MKEYGAEVISRKIVPDDLEIITEAISDAPTLRRHTVYRRNERGSDDKTRERSGEWERI